MPPRWVRPPPQEYGLGPVVARLWHNIPEAESCDVLIYKLPAVERKSSEPAYQPGDAVRAWRERLAKEKSNGVT